MNKQHTEIVAVIPARMASKRLPGKPLANICGKPMIQYVYEQAKKANVDQVLIATDHKEIFQAVKRFGGQVVMTSDRHRSGTDRVAEAALKMRGDIIVNVQGDEPLLHPEMLNQVINPLLTHTHIPMSTLAHPTDNKDEILNPNVVKVVRRQDGMALYFSRSPVPFIQSDHHLTDKKNTPWWRHVGIYAYRADFLQQFSKLPPTPLEKQERLEQLRALEHGFSIMVAETQHRAIGVDTQDDLMLVQKILTNQKPQPSDQPS
ncbi:3-deoxy-manno-octulosonate cytidylyltransferase [Magnetococcales bacterium HHB-1]